MIFTFYELKLAPWYAILTFKKVTDNLWTIFYNLRLYTIMRISLCVQCNKSYQVPEKIKLIWRCLLIVISEPQLVDFCALNVKLSKRETNRTVGPCSQWTNYLRFIGYEYDATKRNSSIKTHWNSNRKPMKAYLYINKLE